jgi:hypothetical protein
MSRRQAGTLRGKLKVYNISTGKCVQKLSVAGAVTALCYEPSGAMLFVGDAKVCGGGVSTRTQGR